MIPVPVLESIFQISEVLPMLQPEEKFLTYRRRIVVRITPNSNGIWL
ncbi:unnamed protein product [Acanthoscelides obtectus]|uniref:Uncharacterized protein n=1 Tax=Acanthoscelides obtectus TaxID=200917 RepID=A0A9P0JTH8_ACAOB|nr:unnamed protein product [Acanthoscelides obtectus]CAK1667053.1 hypothetical protein AOBTE_LOCUS25646 [Acanthoscelides obtectus]